MENFDDIRKVRKVLLGVYIGQAEDELDNIKDRTSSVLSSRAKNGYQLGKAPVGYLNSRDGNRHGIIIPDPEKKDYIKHCFELYATGLFSYDRVVQRDYSPMIGLVKSLLNMDLSMVTENHTLRNVLKIF